MLLDDSVIPLPGTEFIGLNSDLAHCKIVRYFIKPNSSGNPEIKSDYRRVAN